MKGFKKEEGTQVISGQKEMDGWVTEREREREREYRDLMVHEWPENQESLWENLFRPFLEREYFACSTSLH